MNGSALEQRRAKAALKAITCYKEAITRDQRADQKEQEAYRSYVKALPATILMNGLGQALAMTLAHGGKNSKEGQGGKAHRKIYVHLEDWLCGNDQDAVFRNHKSNQTGDKHPLLKALCDAGQQDYLRAQAEAQLYLGWLKKFANALLVPPEGEK
ncbi:type III-B CRISPR module-associated protein Cmr5 [Insolitispirillum peregrinum]|uniref:type III-B CRISPR module-associated protein Cmr5 n=1 Tax=Insolitispirillum peregrinum TaxID=80876 RepID=UPI00360A13BE